MDNESRVLTDHELETISGGATTHLTLELGFARFDLNYNANGACFNWGLGFGGGYDGAACT